MKKRGKGSEEKTEYPNPRLRYDSFPPPRCREGGVARSLGSASVAALEAGHRSTRGGGVAPLFLHLGEIPFKIVAISNFRNKSSMCLTLGRGSTKK